MSPHPVFVVSRRQFWGVFGGDKSVEIDSVHGHPSTDLHWQEMDTDTRTSWMVLGWTERSWDNINGAGGAPPHSVHKSWHELSTMQLKAATNLGYDKQSWDDDDTYQDKLE